MSQAPARSPTPTVPAETLKLRALLERSSVRPGHREELHLVVEVTALGAPVDTARPALSVVLVLDTSGSMKGRPLDQVIRSVRKMSELLAPGDKVGVVAFSDEATEVFPLRALDDDTRRLLHRRVGALHAHGSTNLEAGLVAARGMLGRRTVNERQVVLLLTDGQANRGTVTAEELAAIAAPMRADLSISTLGYGEGHDPDTLNAVARSGGGQYWFISDPDEAGMEFARAIGAQGDIVADSIEVVLSPLQHAEVLGVLGTKVRFTREGPAVTLPDLRQHQKHLAVATVALNAPREPGRLDVIDVKIRYRTAGAAGTHHMSQTVSVDVVDRAPSLVVEAHQAAQMARAELARTAARDTADRGSWDQAAAMLRSCIRALEQVPGYRLADGSPLSECVEQLVDEATEYEQKPSAERYARFKASQLGVDVAQGAKHVADVAASSARSVAMLQGAAGPALPGSIIIKDKDGKEIRRVALAAEMVAGRSPDNALSVPSRDLSRRHTRFCCRDGKLIVTDLGSTNGTLLNGVRINSPEELRHGDTIALGEVRLVIDLPGPIAGAANAAPTLGIC